MTGILDQIRNTTVADLDNVSGDFSDLPSPVYRPRVEREMIRVVKGATDLKDAMPVRMPSANAGMVRLDGTGPTDNRPFKDDQRSEGQIRYMDNLIDWITEKDAELGAKARAWTDGMTGAGKWVAGRDTNVSKWIDSLKAKNAELNAAAKLAPKAAPVVEDFGNVPTGYYALSTEDGIKFYRVTRSDDGRTFLRVQASDEFHLIRNLVTKTEIINAILADVRGAHALYGQHIGRCGRCHRTLTDELSRSRGIGPDCWEKI